MRPDAVLINGYGPTEATTFSCTHRLQGGSTFEGSTVPIGRPLANTRVVAVDEAGRSVPAGVAGELWIGGDGIANRYVGDAGLTAERFVIDPASGARFYRSGDRVRIGADGTVQFLGRGDRTTAREHDESREGHEREGSRCGLLDRRDRDGEHGHRDTRRAD